MGHSMRPPNGPPQPNPTPEPIVFLFNGIVFVYGIGCNLCEFGVFYDLNNDFVFENK